MRVAATQRRGQQINLDIGDTGELSDSEDKPEQGNHKLSGGMATVTRALQRAKRPRLNSALVAWALLVGVIVWRQYAGGSSRQCTCNCPPAGVTQQQAGDGAAAAGSADSGDASTAAAGGGGDVSSSSGDTGGSTAKPSFYKDLPLDKIEEMIALPPPVHGLQQKGGIPANLALLLAHMPDTLDTKPQFTRGLPAQWPAGPLFYRWFAKAHT